MVHCPAHCSPTVAWAAPPESPALIRCLSPFTNPKRTDPCPSLPPHHSPHAKSQSPQASDFRGSATLSHTFISSRSSHSPISFSLFSTSSINNHDPFPSRLHNDFYRLLSSTTYTQNTQFLKPNHISQNDWRKVWRKGLGLQERAVVSPHHNRVFQPIRRVFQLVYGVEVFFSTSSTIQSSLTNFYPSQPFFQGRSRIPSRPCPPSSPQGQLRSACRCRYVTSRTQLLFPYSNILFRCPSLLGRRPRVPRCRNP